MKVFVPRNIQKGWFRMNFQMGPINVSLVQLIILAVGMAISLVIRNAMVRSGASKTTAAVFAVPVFVIFIVVAFFNISEMGLLSFVAKMVRTNMIDTPRKFQDDYERIDPLDIALKKSHGDLDAKKVVMDKGADVNEAKLKQLEKDTLF